MLLFVFNIEEISDWYDH